LDNHLDLEIITAANCHFCFTRFNQRFGLQAGKALLADPDHAVYSNLPAW
jgi:hypothetical protein